MKTSTRGVGKEFEVSVLPKTLPKLQLHHGEALWVLSQLGFQGGADTATFYAYIRSLIHLGTPFEHGNDGLKRHGLANYSYDHLMELALALTLRVYQNLPNAILTGIVRYRQTLYRCYRRAYNERMSGLGAPIKVQAAGAEPLTLRGAFLDLRIDSSGPELLAFGPPRLLSPKNALSVSVERETAARSLLPINLSILSERLVSTALQAPPIRRGPRPASGTLRRC